MIIHTWCLSTGRCGTVTLYKLFQLSKNINSYHEEPPKLFCLGRDAYKYHMDNKAINTIKKSFMSLRKPLFDKSEKDNKDYIELGPHVTFLSYVINSIFPNSKFIHLVRNPEDVIISGINRQAYINNPSDILRICPTNNSEHFYKWKEYTQIQRLSWFWYTTNQWILKFLETIPNDRKILIHSENLFINKDNIISDIFQFVGIETPIDDNIVSVLDKKLNASKNKKVSNITNSNFETMKNFVEPIANKLGYQLER